MRIFIKPFHFRFAPDYLLFQSLTRRVSVILCSEGQLRPGHVQDELPRHLALDVHDGLASRAVGGHDIERIHGLELIGGPFDDGLEEGTAHEL